LIAIGKITFLAIHMRNDTKKYHSNVLDFFAKISLLFFFGFFVNNTFIYLNSLLENISYSNNVNFVDILKFFSGLSVILSFVLFFSFTLFRLPPIAQIKGLLPFLESFFGTTAMLLVILLPSFFPANTLSDNMEMFFLIVSLLFSFAGNILIIWSIWHLRFSFSVLPQARKLVTTGPYKFVRHPLYFSEMVAIVGVVLSIHNWQVVVLACVQTFFQFRRMENEEMVLSETFKEYKEIMLKKPKFLPYFKK